MKLLTSLVFAGALVFATSACNNDRSTGGDSGTDGSIMLMDSGGGTDGGTDTGGRPDTGGGSDAGPSCAPQTFPAPTPNVCANSTLVCLMACEDQACADACFAADPAGMACEDCFQEDLIACATANGCDVDFGCFLECGNTNCASAPDVGACLMTSCGPEITAFDACISSALMTPACAGAGSACFMAAP